MQAAVQLLYEAYDFTRREEGYVAAVSPREREAIDALRPFLAERADRAIRYDDTPPQLAKLAEMAQRVTADERWSDKERLACDTACLRRFLRARDWDLDKAYKLLAKSIEWRRLNADEYAACPYCAETVKSHAVKIVGMSQDLCPVIYTDFKHASGRDARRGPPHLIVTMEKALRLMDELGPALCSEKVVLLVNFEGFGFSDMDPRTGSAVLTILSDHYPERLRYAVLIDAPFLFQPLWNVLKGLLPPETAAKVIFCYTSDGSLAALCARLLDEPTAAVVLGQVARDKL